MKGLVLAGGKGSRLRPFTYSGAKQLVPIANTPVLHFPVRHLVEEGITDIAIVVGDTEPQIRDAMGDGSAFGARFTYLRQGAPLGIAHGILTARDFLGADPFVLYLGDNVLMGGIHDLLDAFASSGAAAGIVAKSVADPRAFGVAEFRDGRLIRVIEKPETPPTDLAVIGVYAFTAAVFEVIERQRPSARGELEIADTINGLLAAGHLVQSSVTSAYWIDTGKMEDILDANRVVLASLPETEPSADGCFTFEGTVRIGDGATLDNCRLLGPVVIGEGATLRDCVIGPDVSIGDGCTFERVSIRNAIVMDHTELGDCPGIADSMIGRYARVHGAPAGARLTLGDHSCIEANA
ncbi:MAG: glucose-1-phosphate thymidylyltransferase [Dehalococcoidia bacterium]